MKFNLTDAHQNFPKDMEVDLNSLEELKQFIDFIGYDIIILSHTNKTFHYDLEQQHTHTIKIYDDYVE